MQEGYPSNLWVLLHFLKQIFLYQLSLIFPERRLISGTRRVKRERQEVFRQSEHVLRRPLDGRPAQTSEREQQLHGRKLAAHRPGLHEEPLDPKRLRLQSQFVHGPRLSQKAGRTLDCKGQRFLL